MNLHQIKAKKNDRLIEELRKLLTDAESGDLQSMAWVAIKTGGITENGSLLSGGTDAIAMLGETVLMQHALAAMLQCELEVPQ